MMTTIATIGMVEVEKTNAHRPAVVKVAILAKTRIEVRANIHAAVQAAVDVIVLVHESVLGAAIGMIDRIEMIGPLEIIDHRQRVIGIIRIADVDGRGQSRAPVHGLDLAVIRLARVRALRKL